MPSLNLVLQSILLSTIVLVFLKFVLSYTNKKNLPPSPPALPFIGHLYLFKKPLHHTLACISQKYGPITFLRFGSRSVLLISSRLLAEECFTTHDLTLANRPQSLLSRHNNGNGITRIGFANYGPYWRSVRRIAAVELLSSQQLNASSNVRTREAEDMARRLFKSWNKTCCIGSNSSDGMNKLELKTTLFELSLNVLMTMIAGKRFYGDNIEDMEETNRFRGAVEELIALSGASSLEDFVPVLMWLDLNGVMKKKAQLAKQQLDAVQKLIEEHRTTSEIKKTMIGHLLESQRKDPEGYSDQIIQFMCMSILLAGTETSSNIMEWAMAILLNNPQVLEKAAAEINKNVGNERLIKESDMDHVSYLGCIVREVLRLYPGAPLLLPHVSREDVTIGGYNIPRETIVLVNVYQIHRDPDIWEEPEKFKPERFENGKSDGKFMIPFGMGRRRCPGEGLAMREVGLILGTLIQCFDWKRITNELIDLTEDFSVTLPKAVPLEAMYRPREAMMKVLSGL